MPKSKKGRLSGGARKELNDRRSADAVQGLAENIAFARVTKMVGAGHVRVAIESKHGQKELLARIPNVLGRRGATPITTSSVVAIYVGPAFNPEDEFGASDHFDITAVLSARQAYALSKSGKIPGWMFDSATVEGDAAPKHDDGFEFDYSTSAVPFEDEEAAAGGAGSPSGRKRVAAAEDDTIDIDAI